MIREEKPNHKKLIQFRNIKCLPVFRGNTTDSTVFFPFWHPNNVNRWNTNAKAKTKCFCINDELSEPYQLMRNQIPNHISGNSPALHQFRERLQFTSEICENTVAIKIKEAAIHCILNIHTILQVV